MNKYKCLTESIEITKEYARSGANGLSLEKTVENVYEMLKKLAEDARNEPTNI